MRRRIPLLGVLFLLFTAACHPGTGEAKRLEAACEAGDTRACGDFAYRLQRGTHVLRDEERAATLYRQGATRASPNPAPASASPTSRVAA